VSKEAYSWSILLAYPFLLAWQALALHVMWNWFVVTHFHVAPLPVAIAAGLILIRGLLTKINKEDRQSLNDMTCNERAKAFESIVGFAFSVPLGTLGIGFLLHRLFVL
jgi:hypothetical protein